MNRRELIQCAMVLYSSRLLRAAYGRSKGTAFEKRVRAQLDLDVANMLSVGAVAMVVQLGAVEVLAAAGYADRERKIPMRTDAIFDVRSICKPLTVLGALLLVQERKLRLEEPIAEVLPEFSKLTIGDRGVVADPITIKQLMTHTSGIAAQRPPGLTNITRTFDQTLAAAVLMIAKQPLDFAPGAKWAYSSAGIAVLGRIIEAVSGQRFELYMQQRLLEPLDMTDSSFFTDPAKVKRIPPMYNLESGRLVRDVMDVTRPNQRYSAPEFGLFSTAEDLRHLAQMMLNNGYFGKRQILSTDLIRQATVPYVRTDDSQFHSGLGWFVHSHNDLQMNYVATNGSFGARGASGGTIWVDPKLSLIRIYLTHHFGGSGDDSDHAMDAEFPGWANQMVLDH